MKFRKAKLKQIIIYKVKWLVCMIKMVCMIKGGFRNELVTINNVRGYLDDDNTAWLNLEDVARGLGFTQVKNNKEYIRWMSFPNLLGKKVLSLKMYSTDYV